MSPRGNGISTTYKTRVATLKTCKERMGIVIGQLQDRRERWPADATKSCARNPGHSKERMCFNRINLRRRGDSEPQK
jgi:hypothetical protein